MNPVTSPDETRLMAAMRVASPEFDKRLLAPPVDKAWYREETESLAGSARTRVRRVVAALNGFDVLNHSAPWMDIPTILPPDLVRDLKRGVLNEKVGMALFTELGEQTAAVLLAHIAAL